MTLGRAPVLVEVTKGCGLSPKQYKQLPHFQDLVSISPNEAFHLASEQARDQSAGHRPDRAHRARPAWPHRVPAQGRQDHPARAPGHGHREEPSRSAPDHAADRRAARGGHALPAGRARRGAGLLVRLRLRRPHPAGPAGHGTGQAPGRDGPARGDPARLAHPPRPRQQPRDRSRRPHHVGRRRQPGPAVPAAVLRRRAQLRGHRQPHHPRHRPHRHGQPHGRGHLPGVQGHREHGADPRPRHRRSAHLPGRGRAEVGHPPRGAARAPRTSCRSATCCGARSPSSRRSTPPSS